MRLQTKTTSTSTVCVRGGGRRSSLMPPKKGAGRGRSLGRQVVRAMNTQDTDQYITDRAAQQAQEAQDAAAQAAMPPPAVPQTTTAPVQVAPAVPAPTFALPQGGSPTIMVGVKFYKFLESPESPPERKANLSFFSGANWFDKKVKKVCTDFIVR